MASENTAWETLTDYGTKGLILVLVLKGLEIGIPFLIGVVKTIIAA